MKSNKCIYLASNHTCGKPYVKSENYKRQKKNYLPPRSLPPCRNCRCTLKKVTWDEQISTGKKVIQEFKGIYHSETIF